MDSQKVIEFLKAYEQPVKIMEVCGTHTQSIVKHGIRDLISPSIRLVSGPGCPVCVTVPVYIDRLIDFAFEKNCRVLSFGDLFKVKGSKYSLSEAKSAGAKIEMIYSPFEALDMAGKNKAIQHLVAAIGFETTIPVYAVLLEEIIARGIENIRFSTSLKAVLPAIAYICENEHIDGFICPGHVSVITGAKAYRQLAQKYNKPFVIAGFEPEHILASVYGILHQIPFAVRQVENHYKSVVKEEGNLKALNLIDRYFTANKDAVWRGIGKIENSAYVLKEEYEAYDFSGSDSEPDGSYSNMPPGCRCGDVLLGRILPDECELFGSRCVPNNAVGACMVSAEGACGIWYGKLGYM